jgi:Surface antigen variable number repeat
VTAALIALVLATVPPAPGREASNYDALVASGVEHGREGRTLEADQALMQAIAGDPGRPEAFVERGGLRFLEKRYDEAIGDLEAALARGADAYARELLASSLYLSGRTDDALAAWNALGQPTLGRIDVVGLAHTREIVVRRELAALAEGGPLSLDALRAARLRLRELGIFRQITLRPLPRGEGKADLEVALTEEHGLAESWQGFAVSTIVNAGQERVFLRYANLGGTGVSLGGSYRWSDNRPETALFLEWPRPFGLPVSLDLRGFRGRQAYDLDGVFVRRSHGLDLVARRVFGARTVGQLALRSRDRSFSAPPGSTSPAPGLILGLEAGVDRKLFESHRQRVDGSLRAFQAVRALGGDLGFPKVTLSVRHQVALSPLEQQPIERSLLVERVFVGWGGAGMPEDEMFAPGGSPEMELPLRAHRLTREGVIGGSPVGRSLVLANVEWRRRLFKTGAFQLGTALFYDGACVQDVHTGSTRILHDVGVGLRLGMKAGPLLRLDYGHGLADGKNAFFIGLSQAF